MKNVIQLTGGRLAVLNSRKRIMPLRRPTLTPIVPTRDPDPNLSVPERGTTGPVPIGELLHPLQRIIAHPDRARLLAKFCEQYL